MIGDPAKIGNFSESRGGAAANNARARGSTGQNNKIPDHLDGVSVVGKIARSFDARLELCIVKTINERDAIGMDLFAWKALGGEAHVGAYKTRDS